MAYWRDQLRPASFRGVPFEVRGREQQGGRRIAHHIYPERDESYPEDLGRKARVLMVDAYLVGRDYLAAKIALVQALEAPGPGEYIDLWGETHEVVCASYHVAENVSDGGYCAFRIELTEYAPPAAHTVNTDTRHAVSATADAAQIEIVDDFAKTYDVKSNEKLSKSALAQADALIDQLTKVTGLARGPLGMVTSKAGAITGTIGSFRAGVLGLIATPGVYGSTVQRLINSVLGFIPAGAPRYSAAKSLTSYGDDFASIAPTTPLRRQMADNQGAYVALVRGTAATEAARATGDIPFAVYDDAVKVRGEVSQSLDQESDRASDGVYRAVAQTRAAVVRDINTRGADLTRLTDVTPTATIPALVLAYQLYGDAAREDVLLARNPIIRHPGFVPGGVTLRVPADG